MIIVISLVAEYAIASVAGCCRAAGSDRLRGQDKKPHIAAWTVGCFASAFWRFPHIAHSERDVRLLDLSSGINADRTSRAKS